jgi:hypothetical protein
MSFHSSNDCIFDVSTGVAVVVGGGGTSGSLVVVSIDDLI